MMIRRSLIALLCLAAPALADEPMGAPEREAYLEACLIVSRTAPELAGHQRLGTGAVTRGHASVALLNPQQSRSARLDCSFAPLAGGAVPTAVHLVLTHADGSTQALDLAAANEAIAERMQ